MGQAEESEEVDVIAREFVIKKHVRKKYRCRCGACIETAPMPKRLVPGGRYSLGVVTADFDNDGWPDIYVACDMTPSLLFRNQHDGTFEERGVEAGAIERR